MVIVGDRYCSRKGSIIHQIVITYISKEKEIYYRYDKGGRACLQEDVFNVNWRKLTKLEKALK